MLNNIRYGYLTKIDYQKLENCRMNDISTQKRTCLFSHRIDADNYNKKELQKLDGTETIFIA